MLQTIPPILPVSDLRSHAKEILTQVSEQPVVITQNGRPSAVMLSYQAYNKMIQQLAQLESYQQTDRQIWSQLSKESLQRVWDNPQDAVYDDWKTLYAVSA